MGDFSWLLQDPKKPVNVKPAKVAGYSPLTRTTGRKDYNDLYEQAGRQFDVDPNLLYEQGFQESTFNDKALSNKGARGPAQFMPDTAREMGLRVDSDVDERTDPVKAIPAQAKLMRRLLDRTNDIELSLSGYNSGHNADIETLRRNLERIPETRNYRDRIMGKYQSGPKQDFSFLTKGLEAPKQDFSFLTEGLHGSTLAPAPGMTGSAPFNPLQPEVAGQGVSSTQTNNAVGAVQAAPVPEHPDTIAAQMRSALDPKSPRAGVLTTEPEQNAQFTNGKWMYAATPNGTLWVDPAKARKLKLRTQKDLQMYVDKNPDAMSTLIGKVENIQDTSKGPAILTTAPNGTELTASAVTSPESARAQAQVDQAAFPGSQSRIVDAQDVVASRLPELENATHPYPTDAQIAELEQVGEEGKRIGMTPLNTYAPAAVNTPQTTGTQGLRPRAVIGQGNEQKQTSTTRPASKAPQMQGASVRVDQKTPESGPVVDTAEGYHDYLTATGKKATKQALAEYKSALEKNKDFGRVDDVSAAVGSPQSTVPSKQVDDSRVVENENWTTSDKAETDEQILGKDETYTVDLRGVPDNQKRAVVQNQVASFLNKKYGISPEKVELDQTRVGKDPEADITISRKALVDMGADVLGRHAKESRDRILPAYEKQRDALQKRQAEDPKLEDVAGLKLDAAITPEELSNVLSTVGRQSGAPGGELVGSLAGGALGSSGRIAGTLGGILDFINDLSPTKGESMAQSLDPHIKVARPDDSFRDILKDVEEEGAKAEEKMGDKGIVSQIVKIAGAAPGDLSRLILLSRLPGGAITGMALDSGAQTRSRGGTGAEIAKSTLKGGALGALFSLAPTAGKAVDEGFATLFNSSGNTLIKEGTTLATIGGGTYTLARATGSKPEEAWREAVVNSAFHLTNVAPQMLGKPIRVRDEQGNVATVKVEDGEMKVVEEEPVAEIFAPKTTDPSNPAYAKPKLTDYLKNPRAALEQRRVAYDAKKNTIEILKDYDQDTGQPVYNKYIVPPELRPLAEEVGELKKKADDIERIANEQAPFGQGDEVWEAFHNSPEHQQAEDARKAFTAKQDELESALQGYDKSDKGTERPVTSPDIFTEKELEFFKNPTDENARRIFATMNDAEVRNFSQKLGSTAFADAADISDWTPKQFEQARAEFIKDGIELPKESKTGGGLPADQEFAERYPQRDGNSKSAPEAKKQTAEGVESEPFDKFRTNDKKLSAIDIGRGFNSVHITREEYNNLSDVRRTQLDQLRAEHDKLNPQVPGIDTGPDQVRRMSGRQKTQNSDAILQGNRILGEIRELVKPETQKTKEARAKEVEQINNRLSQINGQIRTIENLGTMSHKANGELKPKYQRTIDLYNTEKTALETRLAEPKLPALEPVSPKTGSEGKPLPALTDNTLKPLSEYTDKLYREVNVDQALQLLSRDHIDAKPFFANTPNLAKGQGKNKGVLVQLNSQGLRGQVNTSKPGWEQAYKNGEAELIGKYNKSYTDNIEQITIKPEAFTQKQVTGLRNTLEQDGWSKEVKSNGDIVLTRPIKEVPEKAKDISIFAKNKIITADKVEAAREMLRKKGTQFNSGLDPESYKALLTIGAAHVESGARSLASFTAKMVSEFGEGIKKHVEKLYGDIRDEHAFPDMDTPEEKSPTSLRNEIVDKERKARGLEPITKTAKRDFGSVWDEATNEIDKNPLAADELLKTLNAKPRATTDLENAILLQKKVDVKNRFEKAAQELADDPNNLDARARVAGLSDELQRIDDVSKKVGTETGRGLNARKMLANEDFTLASLELKKRAANGGRPLTDVERTNLAKIADDYKAKNDALEAIIADKQSQIDTMQAKRDLRHAQLDASEDAPVLGRANTIIARAEKRMLVARDKLAKRGNVFTSGIDPEALAALTDIGIYHVLKGGRDFAKWSGEMVKEFGEKIKPHLQKIFDRSVNSVETEAHERVVKTIETKLQNQIDKLQKEIDTRTKIETDKKEPIASPKIEELKTKRDELKTEHREIFPKEGMSNEQKLQGYKTRTTKRITELEEKIQNQDFSKKARMPLALDLEAKKLYIAKEQIAREFRKELAADEKKNRDKFEKTADAAAWYVRTGMLSWPTTLAKLVSAATQRIGYAPIEEGVGAVISQIPGLKQIAQKAPREGGISGKAEAKAFVGVITKGIFKDLPDTLKKGESELAVYGKGLYPHEWKDFFGTLHGALKAPAKRAEFERSLQKRTEFAIRNGIDISDPMVQTGLLIEAYKDANRAIFMHSNRIVSAYNDVIRRLEQPTKETGKASIEGKAGATILKILFPIVKIPVNYVSEAALYAGGGIPSGLARAARAYKRGIDNLSPDEADLIIRHLKKGSVGAAALLIGFFNPQMFGGYYQQGEKRDENDAKAGGIKIFGYNIPRMLTHNPLTEAMQVGSTIRRVADSKLKKGDKDSQGILMGVLSGFLGLAEEVPFLDQPKEIAKLFSARERGDFVGEFAKSRLIPGLVQWTANMTDKTDGVLSDTVKRKPGTFLQHLETGIPGLRQNVPVKEEKKARKNRRL